MPDLSLQIKASADSAIKSLDALENRLEKLNGALSSLSNISQFNTLADGIQNLSTAMSRLKASQTAKDFSTLANNLNKIANVNYEGIDTLASGLQKLAPAVSLVSSSNISGSVTRLVNALTKLSGANLSGLQNANFGKVGSELAQLTNTLANTEEVSIRTTKLVEALAKLANAGSGMTAVTNAMPGLTTQLVRFFNAMSRVSTVSEGTIQLTTALAQLANAGKRASATAGSLRTLGTELNNLIGILARSPQVAGSTVELVKALSQISNQGVRINASTGGLRTNLNSLIPSMNRVNKSTKSLASTFGMFYAKFFLLLRAVRGVWSAVKSAMDFVEVYNYFDASIDQIAQKATGDWEQAGYDSAQSYYDALYKGFSDDAKELTRKMSGYSLDAQGQLTREGTTNLGLDPKTMLNYQAQFAQLSSSMGVASDYAMKMSQALTEIGADLASVKNMEFQEVWDNMSSGIVGMSRAVDKYGVNIRNAALQEKLYDLGIDVSITKLGQADKALLRTIMIIDSSREAWADLADTIDQPANQLRMLKANLDSLGRTLGGALLAGVAAILPYINALTIALQRLIQYIIDFFGIQLVSISSQANNNIGDLIGSIDDTEDALGNASGAAKKLKQNLLGIDELNIINTDTSGGAGSGGVGDYSDELKGAFDAIYEEYQKVWDKAYENVENRAKELSDKIVDAFKKGDYFAIGDTISTNIKDALAKIPWDSIYDTAKNWGKNFADFLIGLFNPETFAELGKTVASVINTALYNAGSFLDEMTEGGGWERIGLSASSFVNNFVETFDEKQFAHNISEGIKGALQIVNTFLETTDFEAIGQAIGDFLKELDWMGILNGIWDVILNAMAALLKTFNGIFDADPLAGIIITSLAACFTAAKLSPVITAISTALGGAAVSGSGAAVIALNCNPIGVAIAAAIAAGIIGYNLGRKIGDLLFAEDDPLVPKDVARFKNIGQQAAQSMVDGYDEWIGNHKPQIDFIDSQSTQEAKDAAIQLITDLTGVLNSGEYLHLSSLVDWSGFEGFTTQADERNAQIQETNNKLDLLGKITGAAAQQFLMANGKLMTFEEMLQNVGDTTKDTSTEVKQSSDTIFQSFDNVSDSYTFLTDSVQQSGAAYGNMVNQMKTLSGTQLNNVNVLKNYGTQLQASSTHMGALKDATTMATTTMQNDFTKTSDAFDRTFRNTFGDENLTTILANVPKAFSDVFKNTANIVVGIFNVMIDNINKAMKLTWNDFEVAGEKIISGGTTQLFSIGKIPMFSLGGFPEDGLFFANSNEMVGQFTNGKTAVANNDQIVAGIEQGVYNAVVSAMSQGSQNVNVTLEGDAEGLFRVVRQQNRIYKNSTGNSAFA